MTEPIVTAIKWSLVFWSVLVIGSCVAVGVALSAEPEPGPPATEQQLTVAGCFAAADMAWTARALSIESVERTKADRVMALVYPPYPESLRRQMTEIGYARKESPMEVAAIVLRLCGASGGRLGARTNI